MKHLMAHRSPRSEAGFALIEVIVSAAVLAIVSLAVLSGIDAANGASAREKARAVASNLAEQDQERLRAMPIELLKTPPPAGNNGDVTVDGVKYHIESKAQWITDDYGGEPKCGVDATGVEYLHIITTVKSSIVGTQVPPVVVDSLVAPTTEWAEGHGSLGLKVVDRSETKGVPNVTVSAVSPSFTAASVVTDKDGCAVFKSIPQGAYTLSVNQPGFLDTKGNQAASTTGTVVSKKLAFATLTYDRAITAQVGITTHVPGRVYAATESKASPTTALSWQNGARVGWSDTQTSTGASTINSKPVFPNAGNSYQFFTGTCRYASPNAYPANVNYFNAITGANPGVNPAAALLGDPAQPQPQVATVRQPPFNLRITRRYTTTAFTDGTTQLQVFARLQKPTAGVYATDTCVEPVVQLYTVGWPSPVVALPSGWGAAPRATGNPSGTTNNNHWVSKSSSTFDPGMPFGQYKICLFDVTNGRYTSIPLTYDNTVPNGVPTATGVDFGPSTGWSTGTAGINGSCKNVI
jgi:type II secretory pathway pseudopilin PulG